MSDDDKPFHVIYDNGRKFCKEGFDTHSEAERRVLALLMSEGRFSTILEDE